MYRSNQVLIYLHLLFLITLLAACRGQSPSASQTQEVSESTTSANASGQTVTTVDQGFMVIFQDKVGNHWFGGSEKGLYKYDGEQLILFTRQDGLCSHSIIGIQEDKTGHLYFDTPDGVSKFDGQKFTTLKVKEGSPSANEWILDPNDLWFRLGWESKGPYRYDGTWLYPLEFPRTGMADDFFARYPNAPFNPYGIYSSYQDSNGHRWWGTASLGVCRFDGQTISWLYEEQLTKTPAGGDFGIRSIVEDNDGKFWFCNTRHRFEILPGNKERKDTHFMNYSRADGIRNALTPDKPEFPYFMSVLKDDKGDLWMVSYDEGVWRKDGDQLLHYPIAADDREVFLFSIYQDRAGVLWLGTQNAGIYQFNGEAFIPFSP